MSEGKTDFDPPPGAAKEVKAGPKGVLGSPATIEERVLGKIPARKSVKLKLESQPLVGLRPVEENGKLVSD